MTDFDFESMPHRRYNPLTGDWVLVSPHRTQRPWQGQRETIAGDDRPAYDPQCYLCPGNARAGGAQNPQYTDTFLFTNDFAALMPADGTYPGSVLASTPSLLTSEPVHGECRVICFSPRHDLTLPEMTTEQIGRVIDVWSDQITELGSRYKWVQIFENKGSAMGCSNPHPHGQVWAGNFVPRSIEIEDARQREYADHVGRPLLLDYLEQELSNTNTPLPQPLSPPGKGEKRGARRGGSPQNPSPTLPLERGGSPRSRVVEANDHWVLLVPYWAVWPFEYLLLPRRHVLRLPDLTYDENVSLAEILRLGLIRYDNLFETTFPYSMGWHGAPTTSGEWNHWQLHAHWYPPLLRSATVRKFMVGYEMMAEAQRDLTAEEAAERLRAVSTEHYKKRVG